MSVTIRASSLSELFDCPARWAAKHINGKRLPSSGAAQLGTAVHASTGLYDQARLDGNAITADEAAGALVDAIHRPADDVLWDEVTPREAERIGLQLHARYCSQIAPLQNYAAVELTCEALEIADLGLTLTGTTDRVYLAADGEMGIADLKTGKRSVSKEGVVSTAAHAAQLGAYELLAEHAIGRPLRAPANIIGLSTATGAVGTGQLIDCRDLLIGDDDAPGLLQQASTLIHNGLFYGNPRSSLCSARYCPNHATCHYRK